MERSQAFRFHTPSSVMIVGPSGCGKTVFTTKLLLDHPELFETPPERVYHCYGSWQDGFKRMKQQGVHFHEGIPDSELLPVWFPKREGGVLVLDDLMEEGGNDKRVLDLFTKHSHHQNITVLSTGKIRQEHLPQRPLHREFQEPARSVGHAQSPPPSVPHPMARRARHLSPSHGTSFRVPGLGSASQEQRRPSYLESLTKGRGMHALLSVQARCCAVKLVGFRGFSVCVNVT